MKTRKVLVGWVMLVAICPCWASGGPATSAKPLTVIESSSGLICARVNGAPIYEDEVRQNSLVHLTLLRYVPETDRSQRLKQCVRLELEKLIERELLVQAALEQSRSDPVGLDQRWQAARQKFQQQLISWKHDFRKQEVEPTYAEMKKMFETAGYTMENLRRRTERGYMAQSYLESGAEARIRPGEREDPILSNRLEAIQRESTRILRDLKSKAKIEIFEERIPKLILIK